MKVYFCNSHGIMKTIGEAKTKDQVYKIIYNFLNDHNYKSYYIRIWCENEMTWFDVGSHTEFFACDGNLMEE